MRNLLPAVVLLIGIATSVPATAQADPDTDGSVEFVDTPQIVDSHPLQVNSWTVQDGGRTLRLRFTAGTPECFGVHATVLENADTVEVRLRSGARPEAVARACIMIAVSGTLDVPLAEPLAHRTVLTPY
ncbi:hypothetical protein [Mycobacterium sp. NPDC050041]|uniref:hypothetical protein n=1 Tax=Mycobacterium sp. NPDC050041 TaxID=3364293 RepID=UPI003C2F9296